MKTTSEKYERYFERIFKTFEVEVVRFARMTQGVTKQRERVYLKPTHEAKDLSHINAFIDYGDYGLKFSFYPELNQTERAACVLTCDYVLTTQSGVAVYPLDLILDAKDFSTFVYKDMLSEDLMMEALEEFLGLVRKNQTRFFEIAKDGSSQDRLNQALLHDFNQLIGPLDLLDETAIDVLMVRKRQDATSLWRTYFTLGLIQESLIEASKQAQGRSAYDLRLIDELKSLKEKEIKSGPVYVPSKIEQNYLYVLPEPIGKRKRQTRFSIDVSYVLMLLPMAVLVYFTMGFTFWAVTFYGYFSTNVKLMMGVVPVFIAAIFVTPWGVSFAHQLVYPKDHALYKGYDYRYKHQKKSRVFKALMLSGLAFMLIISSWIGSDVLIFYNTRFSLTPGFLWTSPVETYTYYDLAQVEYRYSLIDESGKTVKYQHYILVYKDGKKVYLKDYITLMHCENVLIPFLIRRNIRIVRYETNQN